MSGSGPRTRSRPLRSAQVLEAEPHMHLQRPSSAWSQDIAHILDSCFGATFSEQAIELETIKNFTPGSEAGTYQSRYADRLKGALKQFETQNNLLDSANARTENLHTAFLNLFASEHFDSHTSLQIPPKGAPDKSLLDLSLFEQTSLISPDSYYPQVFKRYPPPTRDPGLRPNYENMTQNWTEKGQALPLIKDTALVRHQRHSNTTRTLKSQVKNRPKTIQEPRVRILTPPPPKPSENFIANVNSDNYFVSEPQELLFEKYEPNLRYFGQLILRNVSRYLREFRVFSPNSVNFQLTETIIDFSIAPGMTSQIGITFLPDSYGDFLDRIKVSSEDGKSFFIPLKGCRPPPILSLPGLLDCGHSLSGGKLEVGFECVNSGGGAYFAFSRESTWFDPSKHFDVSENCLCSDNFTLSPISFELQNDDSLKINVIFSPNNESEFREEMYLHCSNKSTTPFELFGAGHIPNVNITTLNKSAMSEYALREASLSENGIKMASQVCRCDPVSLGHSSHLEVMVENTKPIKIEVQWVYMLPENKPTNGNSSPIFTPSPGKEEFRIIPEHSTIGPSESLTFTVTFTPENFQTFYSCFQLHMVSSQLLDPVIATLYLEAECQQVRIVPSPPILSVSGAHLIGSSIKQSLQLSNFGCSSVLVDWLSHDDVAISPQSCELGAGQSLYFSVCITRSIPGIFECDLSCRIEEGTILVVPLVCEFRGTSISIEAVNMDIGLVAFGDTIKRTFTVTNLDSTVANVDVNIRDFNSNVYNTTIEVRPAKFEIEGFSRVDLVTEISALDVGDVDCVIECEEKLGGERALLHIVGLIQRPIVVVESSPIISLGDVFINVPVVTVVTLRNLTKLPALFEWESSVSNCECSDSFRVQFSPGVGMIEAYGDCEVEVEIECLEVLGTVEGALFICNVKNADEPILISLSCEARGMSVSFSYGDSPLIPETELDFGTVSIESLNSITFEVRNNTDISAPVSLWVDKLTADLDAGEAASNSKRSGQEFDRYLGEDVLRKRLEFDQQSVWKAFLSRGHGACFLIHTDQPILSPHSSISVELTALSNMWGEYHDSLCCRVEGIAKDYRFPFKINVVGTPLHFHSMPRSPQPIIRFGSHPFAKPSVTRQIRINNPSPCDIRIDWRTFTVINVERNDNLVECSLTFGNPFPLQSQTVTFADHALLDSGIVSVNIRPLDSIQSNATFKITPGQTTIRASSHFTFEFVFFPTPENLSHFGEDIGGYALAYMSLDQPPSFPLNITRPQGNTLTPLRVDFKAGILSPKVEIAPVNSELDEEVLGFVFPASKLLKINTLGQFQSFKTAYQTFQSITIRNPTKQKLNFDIIMPTPLKIADYSKVVLHSAFEMCTLKPGETVTLKIGFTLETKIVVSSNETIDPAWSVQYYGDGHAYLNYKQMILVKFPSNIEQSLPIEARIELPLMKLSTDAMNFGLTQVGYTSSQQACVYNYARKCYCKWRAIIKPDNGVLTLDHDHGLLPGFDGGFDFSAKTLLISFSPKEEREYEFEVVFSGGLGEAPLSLKVHGHGVRK